jgi:SAM-dependent methyltransferase
VPGVEDMQSDGPSSPEWVASQDLPRWQDEADRLANRSIAAGDPVGWFDELYRAADAGRVAVPWDRDEPNPVLVEWVRDRGVAHRALAGDGRRALVVGAGLGRDAEFVASLGFRTTAFDVSETAIARARSRYPHSSVDYLVANLLDPPDDWARAFDLVVEVYTVQAMPRSVRSAATASVANMVGPDGTLIVVQGRPPTDDVNAPGPPWMLTRSEIEAFANATGRLRTVEVAAIDSPSGPRWRAEFRGMA